MIRVLTVVLCVSLSFSIFVFSASAEEEIPSIADDLFADIMPYFYLSDSGPLLDYQSGYASVTVTLPSSMDINYIDMVVSTTSDFNCWIANGGVLSVLSIASDLYRVYGNVSLGLSDTLEFVFEDVNGAGSSLSVISCKAMCAGSFDYPLTGTLSVAASDFTNAGGTMTMTDASTPIRINFGGGSSSPTLTPIAFYPWNANITVPVAKKFDFVDVFFYGGASTLSSITVKHNNNAVPYSISFLGVGADSWYTTSGFAYNNGSASMPEFNEFGGIIRLDLREMNRIESANVVISFDGTASPFYAANYMILQSVTGYVSTDVVDSTVTLLSIFKKSFEEFKRQNSAGFTSVSSLISAFRSSFDVFRTEFKDAIDNQNLVISENFTFLNTLISDNHSDLKSLLSDNHSDLKSFLTDLFNPDRSDISEQGASVSDQIDQIDQVEDSAYTDIGANVGAVTRPISGVSKYANAIAFCSNILGRTFTNLYDYQIVILLPIAIGVFMFICSRAPGSMHRIVSGSNRSSGRHKSDLTVEGGKD